MPKTCTLAVGALALMLAACGKESPTQPSAAPDLGTPQLTVKVDGAESAAAIVGVSEVTFEARTTGTAVSHEIQFGDGQSASTVKAVHVYERAGTFTATLTVTDAGGRRASTSQTVDVKPFTGTWFHLGYNDRVRAAEFHRITITTQEGAAVSGVYSSLTAPDRPMSGMLRSGRGVHLRVDAEGLEFDGSVPAQILAENQPLSLRGMGGSIDGQTLPFRGVIGEPAGAAPDTRIDIRWDESLAAGPIMGLTTIKYDASRSTGDGLGYVIEYGDGQHTNEPLSFHKSGRAGDLVIRLVVADRFARVQVITTPLLVVSLRDGGGSAWYSAFANPVTGEREARRLSFDSHEGPYVTGRYRHPHGGLSDFHGVLSGENEIRLNLNLGGIEFTGKIIRAGFYHTWRMSLLLRGGSADGQTLDFSFDDGPG
jgi:hypothetical protein